MKLKFDVTAGLEKLTGFGKIDCGKGNLEAHFEVEFSAEEMGMIYEFQKQIVPEVLSFVKEMKQENDDAEKRNLENKVSNLEFENKRSQGKIEHAEERLENMREEKKKWFNKAMEVQGGEEEESDLI